MGNKQRYTVRVWHTLTDAEVRRIVGRENIVAIGHDGEGCEITFYSDLPEGFARTRLEEMASTIFSRKRKRARDAARRRIQKVEARLSENAPCERLPDDDPNAPAGRSIGYRYLDDNGVWQKVWTPGLPE